ncbi:MAG: ParB N-terminal domain-containing protein [Parvibaculum sedimenti]|uniref:ParB N-terminal domain-containing protein n=1 Tax=Parvibaculum sedimenti TaxID=2608632 RepID=UPI003BB7B444
MTKPEPTRAVVRVEIAKIDQSNRLRPIDPAWAEVIGTSIDESAQRTPIEIRPDRHGQYEYSLVAGGHRIAGAGLKGHTHIDAFIVEANELEARLIEIDENLIRHELNPLDRAAFLAERKAVYEALHPDTKAGVAGGKARQGSATVMFTFADDAAERTMLSARTIQRAVQIHSKLSPDVRAAIAGTDLAHKEGELYALSRLAPREQSKVLGLMRRQKDPAQSVREAIAIAQGHATTVDPDEQQLKKLLDTWNRAGAKARRQFLKAIEKKEAA